MTSANDRFEHDPPANPYASPVHSARPPARQLLRLWLLTILWSISLAMAGGVLAALALQLPIAWLPADPRVVLLVGAAVGGLVGFAVGAIKAAGLRQRWAALDRQRQDLADLVEQHRRP